LILSDFEVGVDSAMLEFEHRRRRATHAAFPITAADTDTESLTMQGYT
jgi:hypothetical protein